MWGEDAAPIENLLKRAEEAGRVGYAEGEALAWDRALLSEAIAASGLSVREFAKVILVRDPRSAWRWLSAESPLPKAVKEKCQQILEGAGKGK